MDIQYILSCLYFFLPAYFTNMTPPLIARIRFFKFLVKPIDFNKKFLSEPILGSHKTWLGAIFGLIVGSLIVLLQSELYKFSFFQQISFFNYQKINLWLFAGLICGGAVFGDLFFAFIKRRLKLKPGARFIPFDQTNYVIGSALFLSFYLKLGINVWLVIFVLTFFLHIIFNRLGYALKLHQAKW